MMTPQEQKKRLFQILDEMNVEDGEKGTRLVAVSPHLISAHKIKAGTKVTMGADDTVIQDIMNDRVIPILLLVDKKEYFKRTKE